MAAFHISFRTLGGKEGEGAAAAKDESESQQEAAGEEKDDDMEEVESQQEVSDADQEEEEKARGDWDGVTTRAKKKAAREEEKKELEERHTLILNRFYLTILYAHTNSHFNPKKSIFANGPPWTKVGVCPRVCTRLGRIASLNNTDMAASTPRSSQVSGFLSRV